MQNFTRRGLQSARHFHGSFTQLAAHGKEARESISELGLGKLVEVKPSDLDHHSNTIAIVSTGGITLNVRLPDH